MQTFHGRCGRPSGAALAWLAAGVLSLAAGHAARAEEGGGPMRVLAVKTQRADDVGAIVGSRVDKAVGTALAVESRIALVLPEGLADAGPVASKGAPTTDETLIKADKAVDEAKGLFSKGKYIDAVKGFATAMALYEKKIEVLEDFDRYVDAQLGKALAYFAAGYDDNGEDELGKVLTLRPTLVLDKRKVPKAASDALDRLQMLYARSMAAPVTVATGAEGAAVYVDGVLAGPAPARLDKLYRGRHWLRVVADGYEPWADSVDAGVSDRTVNAKPKALKRPAGAGPSVAAATPEALTESARIGAFGPRFDKSAAAFCAKYGLGGIAMTYVRTVVDGFELAGFYFDGRSGKLTEVEGVHLDPELIDLQVNALTLSEHLVAAATGFLAKVSVTATPDVYQTDPGLLAAATAKAAAAKAAAAKAEAAKAEAANAEAAKADAARAEAARAEAARAEAARAEAARVEAARAEAARTDVGRTDAARAEAARAEAARAEAARAEAARAEAARAEAARAEAARAEAARAEAAKTVLTRKPDDVASVSTPSLVGNDVHKTLPPVVDDDDEFYETWWFWTLVSGVLIGGGAATYFALSDSGGNTPSGFRSTVTF